MLEDHLVTNLKLNQILKSSILASKFKPNPQFQNSRASWWKDLERHSKLVEPEALWVFRDNSKLQMIMAQVSLISRSLEKLSMTSESRLTPKISMVCSNLWILMEEVKSALMNF